MPNKKQNRKREQRAEYEENVEFAEAGGKPVGERKVETSIALKAMRGLPKSSYSFQADPYTSVLPKSNPYTVLASFNKSIGGNYTGVKNIDGGTVSQYPTALNSGMRNYFDFMSTRVSTNYRYIPNQLPYGISSNAKYPGKALIDEQIKSISEGVSQLKTTTFSAMDIYNYAIETDMPMGNAQTKKIRLDDDSEIDAYSNLVHVIYAMSRFYQTTLLDVINCINWHNSYRLKMGAMIRSSWNETVDTLNGLFGLFKKKSFLSLLDSLCMSFTGEYVDVEFMKQTNSINLVPSRRSNSITDPFLEVIMNYSRPTKFKVYYKVGETYSSEPIFDLESDFVIPFNHPSLNGGNLATMSLYDAIDDWMTIFSAEDTMKWARNSNLDDNSDTARYNSAKWRLDVINACVKTFKLAFTDYRQVLDTVSVVGLNTWVKKFRPSIVKSTDSITFRNLLVDDIYRIAFGGAVNVYYNDDTKRWRTYTLWNMYDGIPEYDSMSGGSFLTFSLKGIDFTNDDDDLLNYVPIGIVPYRNQSTQNLELRAVNRKGVEVAMQPVVVKMSDSMVYSRLVPLLSQKDLQLRVPSVTLAATDRQSLYNKSTLYKTVTSVCGSVKIGDDYSLDPDVVAVYQIELEDITNDAIRYAREYAPFRGSEHEGNDIGFLGTK